MTFCYHHIYILPMYYGNKSRMNTKSIHFQLPGPDNQTIILQLPFQKCLGESTEVVFLYGNVVIEAESEVLFQSLPEHVPDADRETYIKNNSVDIISYLVKDENLNLYSLKVILNKSFH